MCTTDRQRRYGCRQQYPQPHTGCLRWSRHNMFVLWTFWHRPVARFLWQRWGRQSEHGRHGGDLGGSTTVNLLRQWAPLEAVAEIRNSTTAQTLACVLLVRGGKGEGWEQKGGGGKVLRLKGLTGTLGLWLWQHNDVGLLTLFYAVKKYGEPMILLCSNANLGSLLHDGALRAI